MKVEMFKVLKTEVDYQRALDRTISIFDAQPGDPDFDELELLLVLIKDYEDKHYEVPLPDAIEAIKLKMEEEGLKNKDLVPYIGSEGHVSAVLSGKRNITLEMARELNIHLHIPAAVFLPGKNGR